MSETDQNTAHSVSNENVKRILALLREGDEKINIGTNRDVVLILGNTGSGKSTFTHYIAGNNDNLISTRVGRTSEFIISDSNNKISVNSTVISKTTFPELLIDDETKTAFVDSPGFNDSRNEAYDIASAYFIKKVFDSVKNVKIVLVISYPSLRKGVNRNDFLQLLEHITILIKNIENYADSIALVATKVDNAFDFEKEVPILIPDNSIIDNIAQFLLEVKDSLKVMQQGDQVYASDFKRTENKVFFEHATNLLDILLQKNGTEYTRLGIFRRPNKPGKLSGIPLLQNGKTVLKTMIQNLQYLPVDKTDIGYTVSDKSKNVIHDLVQEITKNMIDDMAIINNNLIQHYKELEERMYNDDMYTLLDHLKTGSSALSRITINESSNIQKMINLLCENLAIMNARVSKSHLSDITNLNKFLIFMQKISAKKFESSVWKLSKELNGVVQHVDNSLKWYGFLATLYQRLSEYDVHQNIDNYILPALPTEIENFQISNSSDFSKFLQQISDLNFLKTVNYHDLKKVYLDGTKNRYFDRLIDATLKDSVTFTCTDNGQRLQVVGEYVKLSEVVQNQCYRSSKSIQIFAKHTIFIDSDLIKDNDISIIAPRWDIIGLRKISLDGSDGEPHRNRKAADVTCNGCNGEDGLPGNPGTSGGHFFGIGNIFTNSEKLTITAQGGDGGFGQHGGDGLRGRNGDTYYPGEARYLDCYENRYCSGVIDYSKSGLFNLNVQGKMQYTYYGTEGGRGGNSGRGGAAGVGGKSGTVTLIGSNDVYISTGDGSKGSFGLHGECGRGGEGGDNIRQYYYFGTWSATGKPQERVGKASNGNRGTCLYNSDYFNSNSNGLQQPTVKEFLYPPSLTLSDFKNHLVNNLQDTIKKHASQEYYTQLQINPKFNKFYNATIVLREVQQIEKHSNQFTLETNALLHQSLLTKVIELAKTADSDNQIKERRLLEISHALLTSKLIRLKNRPENSLPLSLNEYFSKISNANSDEIRHYYNNVTDGRIVKSIEFIKSLIIDDMNDLIEHTDNQIIKLSSKDEDKELENILLQRKLLSSLKTIGEFLSLASSMAKADLVITEHMEIDQIFPYFQLKSVELVNENPIVDEIIEKIGIFEDKIYNQIDEIVWIISKERKSLQSSGNNLDTICNQLRNIEKNLLMQKHTNKKFFSIRNIIQNALNQFQTIQKDLSEQLTDEVTEIIQRSQNYIKQVQFDFEMFREIKSESSTDRLVSAIDHILESTTQLKSFQNELDDVIVPILRTVRNSFTITGYKPIDQSKIRQTVQESVEKLKILSHQMLGQFELDEDLQSLSENTDEAINTLVNEYESLFGQEDRARLNVLYKYAKDRLSDQSSVLQHTLTTSLQDGIILYEYERLVDVFKRYVFPFETLCSSSVNLSPTPSIGQNLAASKSTLAYTIQYLQSKLDALQHSNEFIVEDFFNKTSTAGSFFVWKNQIYGNTISKLFRGKQVALKATITENDNHEMLKFDSIYLGFHSSNETIQQLLDEAMKNFNVFMTHSGNSYLELCNRVHLFQSDSIMLTYNSNETFAKFEPVLSPYTTWTLQLEPIDPNITFSNLEPFQQQIDIHLEGHAKYINLQNKSICEKFESSSMVNDYSSFIIETTDEVDSSKSTRRRRDVSSHESSFSDSFKGKENSSFLKFLNPFSYFIGSTSNSQNYLPSTPKSLEWSTESSHSTSTVTSSFNLNPTLAFLDYLLRNVTKAKPYQPKITSNLDQVRQTNVLEIVDRFEVLLQKLSDNLHIPSSQLEFEPVQLMSKLEKEIVNGDLLAIKKVLRNSVSLDAEFGDIFDTELVQMLDQMNENSNQHDSGFDNKMEEQFYNDYVEHTFKDYTDQMITSYNASLLNW